MVFKVYSLSKYRHHKIAALIMVASAIIVAVAAVLVIEEETSPADDDPVRLHSPFGLYMPGTLDEVPAAAGRTMIQALGLNSLAQYQDYHIAILKDLDVSWVRVDFSYDGWNFIEPVDYLNKLHQAGVEVVGCTRPINPFVSPDLTNFQSDLRHLIRRYPWIKVWQIGNEPNLSWTNPDDYPRFFIAGQQVVRQTCPDCRVALAGAATNYPSRQEALDAYDRILAAISRDAGLDTQPFDIFDMHYYRGFGEDSTMLDSLRGFHQLLDKYGFSRNIEFWVTETATYTGSPTSPPGLPPQTEEQQAGELVRRFVTMLGAQVARISWARVYENYLYSDKEDDYYDHVGLIYNGLGQEETSQGIKPGTRKMGYYTYQLLINKLQDSTQVLRLAPGQYRFDFNEDRNPVFVLWDEGDSRLPGILTGRLKVTTVDGKVSETDASDLHLGPIPVFVEQE